MKNIAHNVNLSSQFVVESNQINNSKALLPVVLYSKMEELAVNSSKPFESHIDSKPILKKLNILKNAFLNETLNLKSHLKKLGEGELNYLIEVFKEDDNEKNVICEAKFSFDLKKK